MKAIIEAISPAGYVSRFEVGSMSVPPQMGDLEMLLQWLADVESFLTEAGYRSSGQAPLTPDGLPICPRHGEVMRRREKQGDAWFSHVVEVDGQELYCKGRPGKDSPGWEID